MNKLKIEENKYQEIADLYKSGLSIEKIEKMYNVSNSVVRRILKICNVQIRDNSHKGRKYSINENYFDNIDDQNKAYILGLLYADGCNYRKTNYVKLELQERDKSILDKINMEINSNKPLFYIKLHDKNEKWQNTYRLDITNKHISEQLECLGVVPNKSLILTFPDWLDNNLMNHFIRGYFDGDGHIEWSKTKFISIASTLQFCKNINEILINELDIRNGSIYDTYNKDSNTKVLHIFKKENIKKFLDYIYKNAELYIERKYDIYKIICKEMSINNSLLA